jgi:hypothetical protein
LAFSTVRPREASHCPTTLTNSASAIASEMCSGTAIVSAAPGSERRAELDGEGTVDLDEAPRHRTKFVVRDREQGINVRDRDLTPGGGVVALAVGVTLQRGVPEPHGGVRSPA